MTTLLFWSSAELQPRSEVKGYDNFKASCRIQDSGRTHIELVDRVAGYRDQRFMVRGSISI